jgi:hypothetical protein
MMTTVAQDDHRRELAFLPLVQVPALGAGCQQGREA